MRKFMMIFTTVFFSGLTVFFLWAACVAKFPEMAVMMGIGAGCCPLLIWLEVITYREWIQGYRHAA